MNKSLFVFAEIVSKVIPFLFLPYLTNMLGAKGIGELTIFQMYWAALLPIFNMSFDTCLNRYYIRYGNRNYSSILITVVLFITFAGIFFNLTFYLLQLDAVFYLALYCALFNALYIVLLSTLHIRMFLKEYAIYQLVNSIILVLFNLIIFEFFYASVNGRAVSLILTFALMCLGVYIHVRTTLKVKRISFRVLKINLVFIFAFSSPLLINGVSNFIRSYIDRYFINIYYTIEELGVYSLAFQLSGVGILFISSMNKVLIPEVYRKIKIKEYSILPSMRFNLLVATVMLFTLLVIKLIPSELYGYVFGDGFLGIADFLVPLLFFALMHIYYFYFSNFLMYIGKTKEVMFSTLVSIFFQIPFVVIVSPLSLEVLVYSPLLSLLSSVLLLFYFVKTHLSKGVENYSL